MHHTRLARRRAVVWTVAALAAGAIGGPAAGTAAADQSTPTPATGGKPLQLPFIDLCPLWGYGSINWHLCEEGLFPYELPNGVEGGIVDYAVNGILAKVP